MVVIEWVILILLEENHNIIAGSFCIGRWDHPCTKGVHLVCGEQEIHQSAYEGSTEDEKFISSSCLGEF